MKIRSLKFDLPFQYPFTIAKASKKSQPTFVVELDYFGTKGYGEAPAISYYNISVEQMMEDLEEKKEIVEKFSFTDPERFWHFLHHLFPKNPFLVCALDMAGWDLHAKRKGKKIAELWKLDFTNNPLTDYTIGIDSIETMLEKIKSKPWPIYKIKVGFENDIEILKAIRKNTDSRLRVDANGGWTLAEALEKIPLLNEIGIELIEQPLEKNNWDGMKILFETSVIPLIADESCVFEKDLEKCVGHFHGINIKLTKCSGMTPARQMIFKARKLGLKVMLGCMNESTIGSAAIAQFLPLVDYADMDGPLLLAKDLASGISYNCGKVEVANLPGLGISPFSEMFQ